MQKINIDLNQEKLQIEKFNNMNEHLKSTFSNTMENFITDINNLKITYFEDLEKYVEKIVEENEKFYNGTSYYIKSLNELKETIDFKIAQEPSYKTPVGFTSSENVEEANTTGKYDDGLEEEINSEEDKLQKAKGKREYEAGITKIEDNSDAIAAASSALEDGITGLHDFSKIDDQSIQKVQAPNDIKLPNFNKNDDAGADVIAATSGITLSNNANLTLNNKLSNASSFTPFSGSFGQLDSKVSTSNAKEGNDLLSGLGDNNSSQVPILESQYGSLSSNEQGEIKKENINIEKATDRSLLEQQLNDLKKSSFNGGTLAGTILSVVLTGALGFASLAFDKFGKGKTQETILGPLNQRPEIIKASEENKEMLVGQQITTTYKDPQFQLAEYAGNYISNLANNPTATKIDYDTMILNYANEFEKLLKEEIEFGMSGLPYTFKNLSEKETNLALQEIASLVDHYGGLEGLLEHYDEVHEFLQNVGRAFDVLEPIMNLSIEEKINALRGLLDEENPNINGELISQEAKKFIIEYLETITGLSIDELLSGNHNEELKNALPSLLSILKVLKALGNLSYEELKTFLYDLINGRFKDLCGITSQNVALLKNYLNEEAEKISITYSELVSNSDYKDELKKIITKFANSKYEIDKILKSEDLYDIILRIINDEELSSVQDISLFSKQLIKKIIKLYARYFNKDIKEFIASPGFKEILYDIIAKLYKYLMFVGMLATLKDDFLQLRIYEIFIGLWIGLLGFSTLEIENLKKKLEKEKDKYNIDLALIINEVENASTLKSILENDDIYKRLLLIFDGLDDEELQKVISNLLESWENEHIYDLKNIIVYVNRKKLSSIINYCKSKTYFDIASIKVDKLKSMIDKLYSLSEEEVYKEFSNIYYRNPNILEKEDNSILIIYLIMIVLLALSIRYTMTVKDMLKDEKIKKNCYEIIKNTPYYLNYINPKNKLYDEEKISELMVNLLNGKYKNLIGEANLD